MWIMLAKWEDEKEGIANKNIVSDAAHWCVVSMHRLSSVSNSQKLKNRSYIPLSNDIQLWTVTAWIRNPFDYSAPHSL